MLAQAGLVGKPPQAQDAQAEQGEQDRGEQAGVVRDHRPDGPVGHEDLGGTGDGPIRPMPDRSSTAAV